LLAFAIQGLGKPEAETYHAEELLTEDKVEAAEQAKVFSRSMRTGAQIVGAKVTAAEKVVEAVRLAEAMVTAAKKAAEKKVVEALRLKEAEMAEAMTTESRQFVDVKDSGAWP